jgi:hypothetical protein
MAADSLALAEAGSAAERRALLVDRLRAAGLTPLAGPSYEAGASAPVVGGFIPGRHPALRTTLVVVAQPLDGPHVAATMEAVRTLVAASRNGAAPERSLLVAFWSPSRGAEVGAADVLRLPVWPASGVHRLLLVGADGRVRSRNPADAPDASRQNPEPSTCAPAADCARHIAATLLAAASRELSAP